MNDGTEYLGRHAFEVFRMVYGGIFPEQARSIFQDKKVSQEDIDSVIQAGLNFPHGLLYVWEQQYQTELSDKQWIEDEP